jgi:hypothetical protein
MKINPLFYVIAGQVVLVIYILLTEYGVLS